MAAAVSDLEKRIKAVCLDHRKSLSTGGLNLPQIKEILRERGVSFKESQKKEELVALLCKKVTSPKAKSASPKAKAAAATSPRELAGKQLKEKQKNMLVMQHYQLKKIYDNYLTDELIKKLTAAAASGAHTLLRLSDLDRKAKNGEFVVEPQKYTKIIPLSKISKDYVFNEHFDLPGVAYTGGGEDVWIYLSPASVRIINSLVGEYIAGQGQESDRELDFSD